MGPGPMHRSYTMGTDTRYGLGLGGCWLAGWRCEPASYLGDFGGWENVAVFYISEFEIGDL